MLIGSGARERAAFPVKTPIGYTSATGLAAEDSLVENVPMAVFREGGETSQRRDVAGAFMASMESA